MPRYDEQHKEKIKKSQLGSKNSNWKGGVSPEYYRIKGSSAWRSLRKRIFERDKGSCAVCKEVKNKWHIHHLIHWDLARELIFDDNNVVTMCPKCHHRTHRLGLRVGEYEKRVNSGNIYVHPRWKTKKVLVEYDNPEPSSKITNRLREGVQTKAEETIMPTSALPGRDEIVDASRKLGD
jgi:hypothetical protein